MTLMISDLATSIIYVDTTQMIWEDLQEFSQPNCTQIYKVKAAISYCKQRDLSITTYYTCLIVSVYNNSKLFLWSYKGNDKFIATRSCNAIFTRTQ